MLFLAGSIILLALLATCRADATVDGETSQYVEQQTEQQTGQQTEPETEQQTVTDAEFQQSVLLGLAWSLAAIGFGIGTFAGGITAWKVLS